jgi:hypothetical protein
MTVPVEIVIAIVSISWSAGMFVGMLFGKFVSKKDCEANRNKIWERLDCVQDCMAGGKIVFEMRQVKP